MRRIKYISSFALVTLFSASSLFAQDSPGSKFLWKSVVPLVSTVKQLQDLMGMPISQGKHINIYDTPNFRATAWYGKVTQASGTCTWNVADDVVVTLLVSPKKTWLLNQIGFDLTKFKREPTPDDDEVWNYVNEETGMLVEAREPGDSRAVIVFLQISPTIEQRKIKCLGPKKDPSDDCK